MEIRMISLVPDSRCVLASTNRSDEMKHRFGLDSTVGKGPRCVCLDLERSIYGNVSFSYSQPNMACRDFLGPRAMRSTQGSSISAGTPLMLPDRM
jgi:hypothetical protein